ncbi:pyridoxamine 5'-phosphate oxidase [Candidatus Marinamargulisbacteria bacterium SCGC AG-439-L15]|nr:pyridoxamine 5'-phosphate oxidase [Candidatus Marinamargulisbacteria bacterium SCGC AG-439-L15]
MLKKEMMSKNPIILFKEWFALAEAQTDIDKPEAFCLSTMGLDGCPQGRIVLMKSVSNDGFIFYTNYNSNKAIELTACPQANMTFFWDSLGYQIRIRGRVSKTQTDLSDDYFESRPRESQLGAWASEQSQVIENRGVLEKRYKDYSQQFENKTVTRPPHWGGYLLAPKAMEFWINQDDRLHDRFLYTKSESGVWSVSQLAP